MDRRIAGEIVLDEPTLRRLQELSPNGRCICEMIADAEGRGVDYRFLWVNRNFEAMTGLEHAAGRTALELVPDLERHWIDSYARVGLGGETLTFEQGSEAMGRVFEVHASPLEPRGRFVIVFRDITERRHAAAALEREVARSKRLLEEINHRVMNTLSLIGSMLSLEARAAGGEAEALGRVRTRVEAVAGLYRQLSMTGGEDEVRADRYLPELVEKLGAGIGAGSGEGAAIRLSCEAEPVALPTRLAVPMGLVVTELVTNSLKHAFPDGRAGRIDVGLRSGEDALLLSVSDDGAGDGGASGQARQVAGTGLGTRLVDAFVRDMNGRHEARLGPRGMEVLVSIPRPDPAARRA